MTAMKMNIVLDKNNPAVGKFVDFRDTWIYRYLRIFSFFQGFMQRLSCHEWRGV